MSGAARVSLVALLLAASTSPAAEPDPRVAEADALLGDPSGFERAAALYVPVLADHPGAAGVRLKRARVLAWDPCYAESLEEYARLLEPWGKLERIGRI